MVSPQTRRRTVKECVDTARRLRREIASAHSEYLIMEVSASTNFTQGV